MEVSTSTRQAYSEMDEFIGLLSEEQRNKVPEKLRQFFKEEKDSDYTKHINPNIPIKSQNLKEETLGLIALLNLKYWCEDEAEKDRLQKAYLQNEERYQNELREKYNTDNLFKNHKKRQETEQNIVANEVSIISYKESILKRIISKIKSIFHRN